MPQRQRGTSSRGGGGGGKADREADSGAAKRKRDASDAGNLDGTQKRRTDKRSKDWNLAWTHQYYQGKSVLDEDMKGVGCGWCRLITPEVPFLSPFTWAGKISVHSGTEGPKGGSIRLGISKDGIFDAVFLIPFRHIEQIVIRLNVPNTFGRGQLFEVIIVPTGATGSSSIKREHPQMISFIWPEKQADDELRGTVGEATDRKKHTYSTLLQKVLNAQLKAFDKKVIDLCENRRSNLEKGVKATLSPPTNTRVKSNIDGRIYFLDQGILFAGDVYNEEFQRIFLPFDSLKQVFLIQARTSSEKIVGLHLICKATEPFYDDNDADKDETLMVFRKIDQSLMDGLEEYLKAHDVQVELLKQLFYDYQKDEPMTGWLPIDEIGFRRSLRSYNR